MKFDKILRNDYFLIGFLINAENPIDCNYYRCY